MAAMNRVFLAGNLTRDPEVRKTPGGTAVSDLGLAISENYTNKAGERVEQTCFADIVVWGRQAEACGEHLRKGSPVMVEGRLQFDQWQTEAGERRSRLRVKASRIQFLGRAVRSASDGTGDAAAAEAADAAAAGGGGEAAVGNMPF